MPSYPTKFKPGWHLSLILAIALNSLSCPLFAFSDPQDPYSQISIELLENGLTLVLIPSESARTFEIEARILAGWNQEDLGTLGIARVTERALFRDHTLGFNQTYRQRIQDAGGQANGSTSPRFTRLFASIPSIKGIWAINEFSNILMGRRFSEHDVEKAKSEVLLEIGEVPNYLQSLLHKLIPTDVEQPDFFESEFGITDRSPEGLEKARPIISNFRTEQIQEFYERYYTPNNIVLFVAGPFKKNPTLSFIRETFEVFPIILPKEKMHSDNFFPKRTPYVRSRVADRNSLISIGIKFWNISPRDEMVLKVYFEHLAHRITGKLRNEYGETYAAEAKIWTDDRRFGFALVRFETPQQDFNFNLGYIQDLIYNETILGELDDQAITRARQFYMDRIHLLESDSSTMLKLGITLYSFQSGFNEQKTPYVLLKDMSNETFREHLRGLFHPQKVYLDIEEPPFFFIGEVLLFYLFATMLSILFLRKLFLREFDYTSIRYVRKIKYSLAPTLFLIVVFINVLWFASQISMVVECYFLQFNFIQSSFILNQYLTGSFSVFVIISTIISYLCLIPRKVIVTERCMLIKSLSYASKKVELHCIKEIFVCRPLHVFTHKLWNRHVLMVHITPWKKGILIRTVDNHGYFMGFKNAEKVARELRNVLDSRKEDSSRYNYHDVA